MFQKQRHLTQHFTAVHIHPFHFIRSKRGTANPLLITAKLGASCTAAAASPGSLQLLPEHPQQVREREDAGEAAVVVLVEHPHVAHAVRERLHHHGHKRARGAAHHRLLGRPAPVAPRRRAPQLRPAGLLVGGRRGGGEGE
uniref:Uncharacterized protein n=1 Tax=Arundo donax TaxID=35708 RepID=A0A0A9DXL1_ARUDO